MDNFRKSLNAQLSSLSSQIRLINLFTAVFLPIIEAILVNRLTDTNEPELKNTLWFILGAVIIIHVILAYTQLRSDTPLPSLLVQQQELQDQIESAEADADSFLGLAVISVASIEVINLSLLEIAKLNDEKPSLSDAIDRILYPWIFSRSDIFEFSSDALYSMAVYLSDNDADFRNAILQVTYRKWDDRIGTSHRKWRAGDGHVGFAFLQDRILFWSQEGDEVPDALVSTQPLDKDVEHYKNVIAAPLKVDGIVRGGIIITSSVSDQFIRELHVPVMQSLAMLVSQVLQFYVSRGAYAQERDSAIRNFDEEFRS